MAKRKLSDKQIKIFGTKAQKAGLLRRKAAKRSGARKARPASKKTPHRPRTAPARKQNPVPQMLALTLGNSAPKTKKGAKKAMALSKSKTAGKKKNRAGGKKKKSFSKPFKRNPGALGSPMDWLTGGSGVLAGVVGTRAIPQLVLAEKNVGPTGYFANGVVAAGMGWLAHMAFPRNRVLVAGVLAGGFAALIARIIGDYTTYGKYLSLTGVGDYMVSNAVAPQRLVHPDSAMVEVPSGWGSAPPQLAFASSGAGDMSGSGVDLGRRAGVC